MHLNVYKFPPSYMYLFLLHYFMYIVTAHVNPFTIMTNLYLMHLNFYLFIDTYCFLAICSCTCYYDNFALILKCSKI